MIDLIDIHTHRVEKAENTFSIYNMPLPFNKIPKNTYVSIGWHPWHIEQYDLLQIEKNLVEFAPELNVLALGECGLDRSIKISFEKQVEVFKMHIRIAMKIERPLIIHCVRAYSDLLETIKKEKFTGKFVLHNFNGNLHQIDSFLKFDAYFSLGKQLLNPISKLNSTLKNIPIERIFLETDNSDFSIEQMYFQASNLLTIPIEELKLQLQQNFRVLFGNELIDKTLFER